MRRTTATLTATMLALGLAACAEEAAGPQDVTVTLSDYSFAGLPDELAAGSTVTIENVSETELHELVAVQLPEGEERSVEELVALPPEELGPLFGGVQLVQLQPPGSPDVIPAAGDGTLTEPGRYLVLCAIPTGADPGEYLAAAAETEEGPPQGVAGGPPHFVNGMYAELVVTE